MGPERLRSGLRLVDLQSIVDSVSLGGCSRLLRMVLQVINRVNHGAFVYSCELWVKWERSFHSMMTLDGRPQENPYLLHRLAYAFFFKVNVSPTLPSSPLIQVQLNSSALSTDNLPNP